MAGDLNELVLEEEEQVHEVGGESGNNEFAKSPTAQDFADINEVCSWICYHGD